MKLNEEFEEQVNKGVKATIAAFKSIKVFRTRRTSESPKASHDQSASGAPSKGILEGTQQR